jgi:hypothetical protein
LQADWHAGSMVGAVPGPRSSYGRRPLIALVILILLLVIGYLDRAAHHGGHDGPQPRPSTSISSLQVPLGGSLS